MTESSFQYLIHHKQDLFGDKGLWLFLFICLVVTGFELVIGVLTESLGCFADCVHRLQHMCEYIIIAIGNTLEKRKKDNKYTFGYGRHEYLYVFTLNLSVVIICCFLLFESGHGLIEGHYTQLEELSPTLQMYSDYLNYISFILSLIFIFGFRSYKKQYHNRYAADIYRAKSTIQSHITCGDVVHILIDLSTIAFTIISNYLSMRKGMVIADLIECCVMSLFMIYTSWDELVTASSILVLGVSDDLSQEIRTVMKRISLLDGVVSLKEPRYWVEGPGHLVGLVTVVATQDTNVKVMKETIRNICSNTFQEMVIQIDQQKGYGWM